MALNRLLEVAISAFGQNGLQGTSTRKIASAADTAMSSITYHYGGKRGLYLAAADYIAEDLAEDLGAAITHESTIGSPDRTEARAALQRIFARFSDRILSDSKADHSRFILREQMQPTEAFDHLYEGVMADMLAAIARLVGIAADAKADAAAVTTIMLVAQAMVPRAYKASMLRLIDQSQYDDAFRTEFSSILSHQIDDILDGLSRRTKDGK